MAVQLIWFKRDLRTIDHLPLYTGAQSGKVICLYVYEPEIIHADDYDPSHHQFINESLAELRKRIRELGGELLIRVGDMVDILAQLHQRYSFGTILCHEETGNAITYARDRRVLKWAKTCGVEVREFPNNGVVRRLASRDGWAKQWQRRVQEPITPEPSSLSCIKEDVPGDIMPSQHFNIGENQRISPQLGGQANAVDLLNTFLSDRGMNYRTDISSPLSGADGCSRLSPYLAYGNISIRQVYQRTLQRVDQLAQAKRSGEAIDSTWFKSLSSFQSRLSWHCHFIQKLEDEPQIEFENVNRAYDGLREEEFSEERFAAWCAGRTGYPMVDACMRALHATGWINFRMRAMLVSFAAYHLWLHWRRPALYLAKLFLDYEPGIHYSQVQMQSGVTGINTIRIYSPAKQVLDQDPTGIFIRQYVPELEGVPDRYLPEPHKMTFMEQQLFGCKIGKDYPAPVVDHQIAYKLAKDRIFERKQSAAARQASLKVYAKHGSRKTPMSDRRK